MCLLALLYRVADDAPVIVGANREESTARPGEPPQILDGPCRIVAGRDPKEGGTWLGVNDHGLLIAVTNRPKTDVPEQARSRGLLARDLLGCSNSAIASELATAELEQNRYRGCNVLCVDRERAVVLHAGDWLRIRALPPGVHVIANADVNDATDPRVDHVLNQLHQKPLGNSEHCLLALRELCAQTENPSICQMGESWGTVSSSLIALGQSPSQNVYLHAQGPPCKTPYQDFSSLVQ